MPSKGHKPWFKGIPKVQWANLQKKMEQKAKCHPDRKHFAGGFCRNCYNTNYFATKTLKRREAKKNGFCSRCLVVDLQHRENTCARCRLINTKRSQRYKGTSSGRIKLRKNTWKRQGFNLTYEEYWAMLLKQEGFCAICDSGWGQRLKVDHDHVTGKVRGLLCNACNIGLGKLGDQLKSLRKAVRYLEERINA